MKNSELLKLKKNLKKGWPDRIAEKCNCSKAHISKVINGHSYDLKIIEAALIDIEEQQKKIKELSNRISSLPL